jgi:hypothetical protein
MCYGLCKCSRFLVHYHSYAATLVFRLLCTKIFCQLGGQHVPMKAWSRSWCHWWDKLRCWLPKPYSATWHFAWYYFYPLCAIKWLAVQNTPFSNHLKFITKVYSNIQFAEILCYFVPAGYTWRRRAWRLCWRMDEHADVTSVKIIEDQVNSGAFHMRSDYDY